VGDILSRSELGRRRQPAPECFLDFPADAEGFFVPALDFELDEERERAFDEERDADFRLPSARAFRDGPLSRMVWPGKIIARRIPLIRMRCSGVVEYFRAIHPSVSPRRTVCT
jgi:hypothetical protein